MKFYLDYGGDVGPEYDSFSGRATVEPPVYILLNKQVWFFSMALEHCVDLHDGWISIQSPGSDGNVFYWATSSSGDEYFWFEEGGVMSDERNDLAVCLGGLIPPTSTPTKPPTATPQPTDTPTATPEPTDTPTATPEPTSTPSPTSTVSATATPECINYGDVDLNGIYAAGDAQLAFSILLGLYTPTFDQECAADGNGDGIRSAARTGHR